MDKHQINTVKADGLGDKIIPVGKYAVRLLHYPAKMDTERFGIHVIDTENWRTIFYLVRVNRYLMWQTMKGIYAIVGEEQPPNEFVYDGIYKDFLNPQVDTEAPMPTLA